MVNAGRMLSGWHWRTTWRSGPTRESRKGRWPMTPPGQPWRNQQPLVLLDGRNNLDNRNPLDNRDSLDNWNPWLLTVPFAIPPLILLPRPIQLLGFAHISFQVLRFTLFQFALFRFAHMWFALIRFTLFRFTLVPWETIWVDCLVAGCRFWMITTHQQNGWHKVGRSGTTMQLLLSTVSDTAMMMKIPSRLWISSGHMQLFMGGRCRRWVYWASLVSGE